MSGSADGLVDLIDGVLADQRVGEDAMRWTPNPVPPRRTKTLPCRVCGQGVEVGLRVRKQPRCIRCGLQASTDAMRQMHARSGPYYDRWLASNGPAGRPPARGTPLNQPVGRLEV